MTQRVKFEIGETVVDTESGFEETVLGKTSTSILITQKKRTDKGINCDNWFDATTKEFEKRFCSAN